MSHHVPYERKGVLFLPSQHCALRFPCWSCCLSRGGQVLSAAGAGMGTALPSPALGGRGVGRAAQAAVYPGLGAQDAPLPQGCRCSVPRRACPPCCALGAVGGRPHSLGWLPSAGPAAAPGSALLESCPCVRGCPRPCPSFGGGSSHAVAVRAVCRPAGRPRVAWLAPVRAAPHTSAGLTPASSASGALVPPPVQRQPVAVLRHSWWVAPRWYRCLHFGRPLGFWPFAGDDGCAVKTPVGTVQPEGPLQEAPGARERTGALPSGRGVALSGFWPLRRGL